MRARSFVFSACGARFPARGTARAGTEPAARILTLLGTRFGACRFCAGGFGVCARRITARMRRPVALRLRIAARIPALRPLDAFFLSSASAATIRERQALTRQLFDGAQQLTIAIVS